MTKKSCSRRSDDPFSGWVVRLSRVLWLLLAILPGVRAAETLPFELQPSISQLAPMPLTAAQQQWLQRHGQALRVGMSINDHEPLDIAVDRNRYQGVSADYLNLIRERLGVNVEIHGFSRRDDAVEALQHGDIDVLTSANGYDQTFEGLTFTTPYLIDRPVLARRADDTRLDLGHPQRQRLAVVEGYACADAVQQAYPDSLVVIAPSLNSALEALRQGSVDAVAGNEIILRSYMALRPYAGLRVVGDSPLPSRGFAFATRRDDMPLAALIDQALTSVPGSMQREILGRWTSGLGSGIAQRPVQLDATETAWIAAHPRVRVAATEYPPYLYRDRQGRWVGLNADLLAALSQMTGVQFEYVLADSIAQSIDLLQRGQAEMNTTLTETPTRRAFLDFTHSYGGQSWVFVLRRNGMGFDSLEEMAGRTLVLPAQHALEDFIRSNYPQVHLQSVATVELARAAVAAGHADATIDSEVGAYRAVSRAQNGSLMVGRSLEGVWSPDRLSVTLSNAPLVSILNKALEAFPVAELRAIRLKWLGAAPPEVPVWQRIASWVYWGAAVAALIALLSVVWSGRLRVQIKQRQRAEVALNDQLVFQKALLDGIPNPVYVRDLEGRLLSCNRSYEEAFGTRFELMKGRQLPEVGLIAAQDAQRLHAEYLMQLENRQPVFVDRQIEVAGRRIDAYQWTVPFYRADGQLQGLLGGWIDITERKQLEIDLTAARQAAEEANLAKSSFLASMSHDIRTPLAAIIGLLELEREAGRATGRAFPQGLEVAYRSAGELLELVGDSLDLARIEAGRLELHPDALELVPFFDDIVQLFSPQAQRKGLALNVQIDESLEGDYWLDALRLRQVMHNLIGNALKFTEQGSVSLSVEAPTREQFTEQGSVLRVSVEDTGIGIDAEQQQRLFQPYVQASAESAQRYGGTGLGLSICHELVTLMGGGIELHSAPGRGTRITLQIPLRAVPADRAAAPAPVSAPASPATGALRLLIVDDLSSNRLVLSRQLEFLGHEVVALDGGEAALQAWESEHFDALITDCNMPRVSGYELARRIRTREAQQGLPRAPIIGCTASVLNDERQRCEAAGMDQWLAKPLSLDALAQALAQLTRSRHFDLGTLHALTQANAPLMQRMLSELDKNLGEERASCQTALQNRDVSALGAVLHRLKGLCALIDAVPLARACAAMAAAMERPADAWSSEWPALASAITELRADIQHSLQRTHE